MKSLGSVPPSSDKNWNYYSKNIPCQEHFSAQNLSQTFRTIITQNFRLWIPKYIAKFVHSLNLGSSINLYQQRGWTMLNFERWKHCCRHNLSEVPIAFNSNPSDWRLPTGMQVYQKEQATQLFFSCNNKFTNFLPGESLYSVFGGFQLYEISLRRNLLIA